MPEENIESFFPVTGASACPSCKSTNKLGPQILEALVRNNKMKPGADWSLRVMAHTGIATQKNVLDPTPIILMIGVDYEICADCFTMYVVKVDTLGLAIPQANRS